MLPIWFVMLATVAQQSPSIHDDTLHFTLRVPSTCRYSPDWSSVVKTPYAWACQSSRSGLVQFKVSLQALAGEVRESNFDSTLNLTRLQNPTASAIALQWRAGEIHGWSMDLLENLQVVMVAVPLEGRALQLRTRRGVDFAQLLLY